MTSPRRFPPFRVEAMYSQKINRISAIAPIVMSLAAFLVVLAAVTTGWGQDTKDEGASAHGHTQRSRFARQLRQLGDAGRGPSRFIFASTPPRKRNGSVSFAWVG